MSSYHIVDLQDSLKSTPKFRTEEWEEGKRERKRERKKEDYDVIYKEKEEVLEGKYFLKIYKVKQVIKMRVILLKLKDQ